LIAMAGFGSLLLRAAGMVTAVAAVTAAAGCTASTGSSPTPATTAGSTGATASSAAPSGTPATSQTPQAIGSSATSPGASASPSASASAVTSSGTGGSGNGTGTPGCATRDLSVKAGASQGAAGSLYQVLEFTNISNETCTLFGYPGVALAGGNPVAQVGAAATRDSAAKATLVTLDPGATASTLLRITEALNYPESKCSPKKTTFLQIYPPNETTPVYVAFSSTGCASTSVNLLTIGVMRPGTSG
jgi:hypothetical protein